MDIQLLAFGIAKEIISKQDNRFDIPEGTTVQALKALLILQYPDFSALASLKLAVNGAYVTDDYMISAGDEVAIIPPVSGG